MTYSKQLHPWCIIRILTNKEKLDNAKFSNVGHKSNIVARFRRRDDAVAYLQVLRGSIKNIKNIEFLIIFDLQGV
ncbi:MAG: hypothetical protein AAGG00_13995 [Cyanobacteria bacterium P01_H01_bin.150]